MTLLKRPHAETLSNSLYDELAHNVSGRAHRVIVGLNWTLVAGPDGVGVSHTPTRGTNGCRALPQPGAYAGRDLSELVALRFPTTFSRLRLQSQQ